MRLFFNNSQETLPITLQGCTEVYLKTWQYSACACTIKYIQRYVLVCIMMYLLCIMISTQHCDKMVAKKGEEWNLSEVTARLTSDEVSLHVADGKGWNIIFDKEPTKVST